MSALASRLDLGHVALGMAPTPVRPLDLGFDADVWVKDESTFGDPAGGAWGGNKVRKLEWIIPEAHRRGARSVLSVGGIGTHWGLALATYGAQPSAFQIAIKPGTDPSSLVADWPGY